MHKLYKNKSSTKKLTDLHYISDKKHSDSKYVKKPINSEYRKNSVPILLFGHGQILET